jgi:hypothetical protein
MAEPWRIERTRDRDVTVLRDRESGAFVARLEREGGPSIGGGTTYYAWDAFDAEGRRVGADAYYRDLCGRLWREWHSSRAEAPAGEPKP